MTIIFEMGDEFWIESFNATIPLVDASGSDQVAFTSARSGTILGWTITSRASGTNDNITAVRGLLLITTGGALVSIGTNLPSGFVRANKIAGTAGNTDFPVIVTMMMRKTS